MCWRAIIKIREEDIIEVVEGMSIELEGDE